MRKILVTGGAGFIGVNLVHHLLEQTDLTVTVLDRITYAASPEALAGMPSDRVEVVVGDVTDGALVNHLVAGHDTVVHAAAESHNDNSLRDPTRFVHTNVLGTLTVLEAVRRHDVRMHHISTDEVHGDLPLESTDRFDESTPYAPSSPYSASKASADHLVRAWVRSFGVAATISNSSNNYGPWQHVEKFIPRQITALLEGERPRVFGSGDNVRDWIHVADHVSALLRILEAGQPGETYLVGADCERSNRDVVRTLLRLVGRSEDDIDFVDDRPGHDLRYAIDASRVRGELGWSPEHADLAVGLERTIEWYRCHAEWWRSDRLRVETGYRARGQ
ncbi:dTDP-glucose 4,6-dehydratase [Nocardioides panacisoli]|uniref:dTDP-glucose 4,6-dehydratase n=1 Tax=Nocardioides panacisoli TaxID=627624 RepID=UPI001C62ED0C|nr:dTDP-glucose 4,6-dehydratase [Nocardioides panacisoli]